MVGSLLTSHKAVPAGWWFGCCRCHPEIRLRTPATLSVARARAKSQVLIDNFFDVLEYENQLIFRIDESGFPLDPKPRLE